MTVTLIESSLQRLLNSETGPIGRDTLRRGEAVLQRAFRNASGGFVDIRTGDLGAGLRLTMRPGPIAEVASTATHRGVNYGLILERGSEPHPITAVNASVLVSERDNPDPLNRRNLTSVNHPGTVRRPWLSEALEAARV